MTVKKLLENYIENNVPDESVAVLLSGGIDSISVALAAHNCGKKVKAYSFYLEEFTIKDRKSGKDKLCGGESYDCLKAELVAKTMGWKFVKVKVPKDNLIEDWNRLVKHGCRKKTHFETIFPFLYVYPNIKETYVLTGYIADGYFQPGKTVAMRYVSFSKAKKYMKAYREGKAPRVTWNQHRLNYIDGDCAGLKQHTKLTESYNKIHITPYGDKHIREYLMAMSWKQLNKPRQKEIVRKDFTELEKFGIIKPHQNLHLGAGIQYLFDTLLDNKEINFKGRKRMMDVSKDWYDQEQRGRLDI